MTAASTTPSCGRRPTASPAACAARASGRARTVGILARNHRGFVIAVVAAAKLGADIVHLNTGFAGPQLADVVAHEGIDTVLHDDEFAASPPAPARRSVRDGHGAGRRWPIERQFLPLLPTRRAGRR